MPRLDPVVIAQLGNLHLRARRILDGLYSGHHTNVNRGTSQEFSEHRPYNPGDDPKGLDWKIYGRTDRLVIKQFEEETNLQGTLLIDDSASMNFSHDGRPSKLEYAKSMAAALGYLLVSQHDSVGLISRKKIVPASNRRAHLEQLFRSLDDIKPEGSWNFDTVLDSFGPYMKKRSIIMVFSDLLEDPEKIISTLRTLHARKHEVIVFQIFDPAEKTLPFKGPFLFEDSETHEVLKTDPDAIREAYQQIVKNQLDAFSHVFQSSGMDYLFLTTDTPFNKGLGAFLSWRGARI